MFFQKVVAVQVGWRNGLPGCREQEYLERCHADFKEMDIENTAMKLLA